jgi:flagellin
MPLYVNFNGSALVAQRSNDVNRNLLEKSFERLSTGYRINRSSDDAAGIQISERLRSQIRGFEKARDNVQDGMNVLNIADGAMMQVTENLQRMRELAVQGGNDTLATAQRTALLAEMSQLVADISRMANSTQFNGVFLLDGSQTSLNIQVGPNNSATADVINVATVSGTNPFASITGTALGLAGAALTLGDNPGALAWITAIDTALGTVNVRRATIGALVNRLSGTLNNIQISYESAGASESRIRNVDVARETTQLSRMQILNQASLSVLQQANQLTAGALSLLQG